MSSHQKISDTCDLLRMGITPEPEEMEAVLSAAQRIAEIERCDSATACIHVWHSGLGKKPWMFEIRRAGVLYGAFMDVPNGYDTRVEAEAMAIKICDSMIDGTFQEIYTYMRTNCPRCKARVDQSGYCSVCLP